MAILYVFSNFTLIKQKLKTITKSHIRENIEKTTLYTNIKHGLSNTHVKYDTNHYMWCDKHTHTHTDKEISCLCIRVHTD